MAAIWFIKRFIKNTRIFLEMIKIEHTVFALPFAYIGALLVEKSIPSAWDLFWITLAMIGARTAAMCLNRIIDRHIDAKNPRTANRALPKGLIGLRTVWIYTFLSLALLFFATLNLSNLALKLFPVALFMLFFYPYTKRFTWFCHLFLGATLALAPVGAWVAISDGFSTAIIVLGLGVMFWVAGFDIIYACSDYDFDRKYGIYSIPARFGIERALVISLVFHVLAIFLFALTGFMLELGIIYLAGVFISAVILFYQHKLVREDLQKGSASFFKFNGILSIVMFLFVLLDILWEGLM